MKESALGYFIFLLFVSSESVSQYEASLGLCSYDTCRGSRVTLLGLSSQVQAVPKRQ